LGVGMGNRVSIPGAPLPLLRRMSVTPAR